MAASRLSRSSRANPSSSITTLASRASSRLNGSMLEEPTVAQWQSMTATFACIKLSWYS